MKFINVFCLIMMGVCSACYDDKGNSNYTEKLNIRVENVEMDMKVNVASRLELRPEIYPENREYECFWGIVNKNDRYGIMDTLSRERELDFSVDLKTGNYLLRFYVRDVETGIFSYTEYNLLVETDMAVGWWVLKNGANGVDIDLFTPDHKIADVMYSRSGHALAGNALDISYTDKYWVYDALGKDEMTKVVFVGSDRDLAVIDFFTGYFILGFDNLFYERPKRRNIQALFRGASDTHVIVDDQIYTMPNMKYDHYRQFVIKHQGDYMISPCRNASGLGLPLLFDSLTSSFCTVTRNLLELNYLGNDEYPAPHKDLDADLLFLGGRTIDVNLPGKDAYAILKKKNLEKYWLVSLNGWPDLDKNPMQNEWLELPYGLNVLHADFRAMNQDNDVIYFFKDNKLFSYDLTTLKEREQNLNLASDETITYMEYVKYTPWGKNGDWFTYLVIGTVQGERYKLYLHRVQAGMVQPATEIFEGEGQVKRAIYINNGNTSTFF